MNLKLRPFFLGGIMKESGNKPPMMVPNKGVYMNKDLARIASYYGVPLKFIEVIVINQILFSIIATNSIVFYD